MINQIDGSSYFRISGGNLRPYIDVHKPLSGTVRYNNSGLECFNGYDWINITNTSYIDLEDSVAKTIAWASRKMEEEEIIERLAKDHPAIQLAYENFKKAEEQLKATIILSKEHDIQTTR
jgi:hypothetical protein